MAIAGAATCAAPANKTIRWAGVGSLGLGRWLRGRSIGKIWSVRYGNQWPQVSELLLRSARRTDYTMAAAGAAAVASVFIFAGLAYLCENNQEAALKLTSTVKYGGERDHLTCSESF